MWGRAKAKAAEAADKLAAAAEELQAATTASADGAAAALSAPSKPFVPPALPPGEVIRAISATRGD